MQSITSAIQVLGRTHTVPGKSKLKAAGPKLKVGPINTSQCACMAQAMDSLVMARKICARGSFLISSRATLILFDQK